MKRFALAPLVLLPALTLSGCGVTSAPLQIPDAAPASTGAARGGSGSAGTAAPTPAGGVIDAIRRGFAANPAYTATVSSTGNCGGTSAGVRGTETVQRAGGVVRADLKADSPATFDRMIRVGDDAWVRITPGSDYEKTTVREMLTDDAVLQGGQTPEEIFERVVPAIVSTQDTGAETVNGVPARKHTTALAKDAAARMGGSSSGDVSLGYTLWVDGAGRLVKQRMVMSVGCEVTQETVQRYGAVAAIDPPA